MAKRVPLSQRRANDARGLDVIFGTSKPANGEDSGGSTDQDSGLAEAAPKTALSKVTLYIRPDQVLAVETIQLEQRQKTGKKPDKSDLIQEALDLLIEKYSST